MLAPGAQVTLDKAIPMVGTCEEMCPAREMIKRIQFNIDLLEPEKVGKACSRDEHCADGCLDKVTKRQVSTG